MKRDTKEGVIQEEYSFGYRVAYTIFAFVALIGITIFGLGPSGGMIGGAFLAGPISFLMSELLSYAMSSKEMVGGITLITSILLTIWVGYLWCSSQLWSRLNTFLLIFVWSFSGLILCIITDSWGVH